MDITFDLKKIGYIKNQGVYVKSGRIPFFNYSHDDVNYIQAVISNSSDLSTGSEELYKHIHNSFSLYHFSPNRVNLLRPFQAFLKNKNILEIESDCGAITRFLAEHSNSVLALERNPKKALITYDRCRELGNVEVINQGFEDFPSDFQPFDIITLIGVLPYKNASINNPFPDVAVLQKACSLLSNDGILLIATENKLGLKYFSGVIENSPYQTAENSYDQTYSKEELRLLLNTAGFNDITYFYPFPDYKLPHIILTEKGINNTNWDSGNLLLSSLEYFQNLKYNSNFCTDLIAGELGRNKLLGELSNSFLIAASKNQLTAIYNENSLGYTYNATRKKVFCKSNEFVENNGTIEVVRKKLYETGPEIQAPISHELFNESYNYGNLYLLGLIKIINSVNWKIEDLIEWADPYYQVLLDLSNDANAFDPMLEGKYIDASPFNLIKLENNNLHLIDLEWIANSDIPASYVFFRGIFHSLTRQKFIQSPDNINHIDALSITGQLMNHFWSKSKYSTEQLLEMEEKYFSDVILGDYKFYNNTPALRAHETPAEPGNLISPVSLYEVQVFPEWQSTSYRGDINHPDFSDAHSISLINEEAVTTECIVSENVPVHKKFITHFLHTGGVIQLEHFKILSYDKILFDIAKIELQNIKLRNMLIIPDQDNKSWFLFLYKNISTIEFDFFNKTIPANEIKVILTCKFVSYEKALKLYKYKPEAIGKFMTSDIH